MTTCHRWSSRSLGPVKKLRDGRPVWRGKAKQGYRSCLGIIRLANRYSPERLEAACARALSAKALSYRSVESILRHGLDTQVLATTPARPHRHHQNLRGPTYYR